MSRQPHGPGRGWSWPHYLAIIGVPIFIWNLWTVAAWIADGPEQVTQFRDRDTASWYAARAYELLAIVVAILVAGYVVRSCIRSRQILTFDVMFCLVGATIFWSDMAINITQPAYLVSSNFVNLTNTCGHMPFVVNPDCGRAPDPILLFFLVGTFGLLGAAVLMEAGIRRVRHRRPGISTGKLVGILLAGGMLIEVAFEPPAVALGLWTYSAGPLSLHMGKGLRLPLLEVVAGGLFFGIVVALRTVKDDKGRTLLERGLEHHVPRVRKLITGFALYGAVQLAAWIPGTAPVIISAFYQGHWQETPSHLVNDVCNAPGITGTRYGTCPGDPGFRMPGRHSLPGRSP